MIKLIGNCLNLEKSKSLSFSPQNVEPLLRNREHCADSEECSKPVKITIYVDV